jgi:hypothetical protein
MWNTTQQRVLNETAPEPSGFLPFGLVPKVDDHAARLARIRRLCASWDEMHEQAQRICRDATAEARRTTVNASKLTRKGHRKR